MSVNVFICYARVDQAFALPLAEQLRARGIAVWVDQKENIPAEDWDREIDRALRECSHLLIVLTPASVDSREVRGELRTALDLGKPILPVLCKPCELPRQLRVVQFVDFVGRGPDDEDSLNQLIRGLQPGGDRSINPLGPAGPPRVEPAAQSAPPANRAPPRPKMSGRTRNLLKALAVLLLLGAGWYGLDAATSDSRHLNDVKLSPDGAWLAAVTGTGTNARGALRVWDVSSGRESLFIPLESPTQVCAWSPDGTRLAVGAHSGAISIYETGNWKRTATLSATNSYTAFIAWAPDSTALATGDSNGTLWVWNTATGALRFSKPVHSDRIDAVAWAPNGTRLASGGADHSVALVDAVDGSLLARLSGHASVVSTLAFSPDGARLASGSLSKPFVIVWDSNLSPHELQGSQGWVERVSWSSDGRFIAAASKDDLVHLWDGTRLDLLKRINLRGNYSSGTSISWSPVGQRVAVGDAEGVRIIDPQSDTPLHTFAEKTSDDGYGSIEIAGWSADGGRLGTFGIRENNSSSVWDVERNTRLQTFRIGLWESLIQ